MAFTDRDGDSVRRFDVSDCAAQYPGLDREPYLDVLSGHDHWGICGGGKRATLGLGRQQTTGRGVAWAPQEVLHPARLHGSTLQSYKGKMGRTSFQTPGKRDFGSGLDRLSN